MYSKVILVSGASSGFGRLAVSELLKRGHRVIAGVRGGEARAKAIFSDQASLWDKQLFAVDLHLEDPQSCDTVFRLLKERFEGQLDVLVNNAGYGLFGALEDQDPEQLRYQFDVNFFGPAFLIRHLLPLLRLSKGKILNVSSIVGLYSIPFYGSYSASKHALEAMSESLRFELAPFGVQVGLIQPGGFKTDFSARSCIFGKGANLPTSVYTQRTRALRTAFETSSIRLANPARVSKLIADLCEREKIPLRSLIGADAWLLHLVGRLLPDWMRVGLMSWIFKKAVFKE
ncbi:SDR family oxidoreductase [Bdellovibrionota bacterium FG-2]